MPLRVYSGRGKSAHFRVYLVFFWCLIVVGVCTLRQSVRNTTAATLFVAANFSLSKFNAMIQSYSMISFDIFDTLLFRPYVNPSDLWLELESQEKIPGFAKARSAAYYSSRTKYQVPTFDDIYNEIDHRFSFYKEQEKRLESELVFLNDEMKQVYDLAIKCKKRVIIVSDMYYQREFLQQLLSDKGIYGYSSIYVSSDYRKTKSTGDLFDVVLSRERIKPNHVLHIGDTPLSDQYRPSEKGISSLLYPRRIDEYFSINSRAQRFYANTSGKLEASRLLGVLAHTENNGTYWQRFGFEYAGPVIYGYMKWLSFRIPDDNSSALVFVARDGYSLKRVFDMMNSRKAHSSYIYFPRTTSKAILFEYKKYPQMLVDYYLRKDILLQRRYDDNQTDALSFIESNKNLFTLLVMGEKEEFLQYLEQFHLTEKRLLVVDSGTAWFTTQRLLQEIYRGKTIEGYYWCIVPKINTEGLTFTTFDNSPRCRLENWDLMELIMTSPHPPAEQVANGTIQFGPITESEAFRISIYHAIEEGILNFASRYSTIFKNNDRLLTASLLSEWLNIFCQHPTQIDLDHFSSVYHATDPAHSVYKPLMSRWYKH